MSSKWIDWVYMPPAAESGGRQWRVDLRSNGTLTVALALPTHIEHIVNCAELVIPEHVVAEMFDTYQRERARK